MHSRYNAAFLRHTIMCRNGHTALLGAANGGHDSIVRLLLEHQADVNAVDA